MHHHDHRHLSGLQQRSAEPESAVVRQIAFDQRGAHRRLLDLAQRTGRVAGAHDLELISLQRHLDTRSKSRIGLDEQDGLFFRLFWHVGGSGAFRGLSDADHKPSGSCSPLAARHYRYDCSHRIAKTSLKRVFQETGTTDRTAESQPTIAARVLRTFRRTR